ncbi:MAG: class I SAM-dependent methyltransferase [Opitutaceae bacterium]
MQPAEYARLAEAEERLWYLRALRERVVRACVEETLPPNAIVLDAGCGTGGLLRRLQRWRGDLALAGVDVSPLACAHAHERGGFEIREGSIEELPFDDNRFDAIVTTDVLTQVESPLLALVECFRCLKPGGLLVANSAAMPWLWSYHDECVQSLRRFRGSELRRLVREAGFEMRLLTHWNFLLLPLAVVRRKVFPRRDGSSDVKPPFAPVNAAFGALAALERAATRAGVRFPIGSSLFVVARRPMRRPRVHAD